MISIIGFILGIFLAWLFNSHISVMWLLLLTVLYLCYKVDQLSDKVDELNNSNLQEWDDD